MRVINHKEKLSSQSAKDLRRKFLNGRCIKCLGMAAVPQSFHMAKAKKKRKAEKESHFSSTNQYQYIEVKSQPLCYSNKMMNSIWGQYNMYSVHNLKAVQNDAEVTSNIPLQQMLQENQDQHSLNLPNTQEVLGKEVGGYVGQQLKKIGEPVKNFSDFLGH